MSILERRFDDNDIASLLAPLEARRNETMVPHILICVGICTAMSVITILLRYAARYFSGLKFALHDWLITVAWFFVLCQLGTLGAMTLHGLGRHVVVVINSPYHIQRLQILNTCNEVAYFLALGFTKCSLLSLFMSIFPQKTFHYICWIVAAFTAGWSISSLLVTIFTCTPPAKTWDPVNVEGTCVNFRAVLVSTSAINIFTDLVLIVLPLPLVFRLKLSQHRRVLIYLTFSIGGLTCIAGAIRLAFLFRIPNEVDGTWDTAYTIIVSAFEATFAFLCACLPTYRPLYRRIFYGDHLDSTQGSSRGRGRQGSTPYRHNISDGSRRIKMNSDDASAPTQEKPGIYVRRDIELSDYDTGNLSRLQTPDDETRLTGETTIRVQTPDTEITESFPARVN